MCIKWYHIVIFVPLIIICGIIIWHKQSQIEAEGKIKVGIIYSLTGPSAIYEKNIVDTTLMAIEEINEAGGVLAKKIVPIIADAKSDPDIFAQESERLIAQEDVVALFAGGVSATTRKVKDILEKYNSILFYPHSDEGLESSSNIIYNGPTSNQQIIPALIWCLQNLGQNFYLVGNKVKGPALIRELAFRQIIRDVVFAYDGRIVGEVFISPQSRDIEDVIKMIDKAQPDVIINNLNGEVNRDFFRALRSHGISSEKIPTMSFNVTEVELAAFDINEMVGDYATQSYFQSLNTPANKIFLEKFKDRFGPERIISSSMENAYSSVFFWHIAALKAKSTDTTAVLKQLSEQTFSAPEGIISIDKTNLRTWKPVLIGKIFPSKQFGIVWDSFSTTMPMPIPPFRSKEQWEHLINKWHTELEGK